MNREIKFRAWKYTIKQMIYNVWPMLGSWFVQMENGQICTAPSDCQQYTGLKDKNGKDIYEGDIVREHIHEGVYVVKFIDGSFDLFDKDNYIPYYPECRHTEIWEVIGNIYENPKLLEVVK